MTKIILKTTQTLWGLFLVTLPWQTHYLINDVFAYHSGLFTPYTACFFYLAEAFLVASFIFWIIFTILNKQTWRIGHTWIGAGILGLFFFTEISYFGAIEPEISSWVLWRIIEWAMIYLLIVNRIFDLKYTVLILGGSFGIQAIIAILQFIIQMPLGLHIFGEPYFSSQVPSTAKLGWLIRPYGTMAHPNVLAGSLLLTFFLLGFLKKIPQIDWLRLLLLIALILTFSRSALLALVVSIIFFALFLKREYQPWQKLITKTFYIFLFSIITLVFISWTNWFGESLSMRLWYNQIAQTIIIQNPLGVGASNFTLALSKITPLKLLPWDIQPVHNIYLLIFSELGIIAGLAFWGWIGGIIYLLWQKRYYKEIKILLTILVSLLTVIFNADHYFWDIFATQAYFWILISLISLHLYEITPRTQLSLNFKTKKN